MSRSRPDRRPFGRGPYVLALPRDEEHWDTGFPFDLPAINALQTLSFETPVTFLVGENGTGKSTVVEAIAQALRFDAEGGTTGTELGRRHIAHDPLANALLPRLGPRKPRNTFFLRAESFFNIAQRIDDKGLSEGIYGEHLLHEQSHGESFLALAANRFGPDSLYLLDEPEAALSVTSALAFLAIVARSADAGSQFIIATHSPILLALPGARIYELSDSGAHETTWDQCDPTSLTRSFLNEPERFLRQILGDAAP